MASGRAAGWTPRCPSGRRRARRWRRGRSAASAEQPSCPTSCSVSTTSASSAPGRVQVAGQVERPRARVAAVKDRAPAASRCSDDGQVGGGAALGADVERRSRLTPPTAKAQRADPAGALGVGHRPAAAGRVDVQRRPPAGGRRGDPADRVDGAVGVGRRRGDHEHGVLADRRGHRAERARGRRRRPGTTIGIRPAVGGRGEVGRVRRGGQHHGAVLEVRTGVAGAAQDDDGGLAGRRRRRARRRRRGPAGGRRRSRQPALGVVEEGSAVPRRGSRVGQHARRRARSATTACRAGSGRRARGRRTSRPAASAAGARARGSWDLRAWRAPGPRPWQARARP